MTHSSSNAMRFVDARQHLEAWVMEAFKAQYSSNKDDATALSGAGRAEAGVIASHILSCIIVACF